MGLLFGFADSRFWGEFLLRVVWWGLIFFWGGSIRDLFVVLSWFLWTHRNEFLWNQFRCEPEVIINRARIWLDEYRGAREVHSHKGFDTFGSFSWVPPTKGSFKLNVDGAMFREEGWLGIATVIWDCDDFLHAVISYIFLKVLDWQCLWFMLLSGQWRCIL